MKKTIAIIAIVFGAFSFQAAKAQLSISINIGKQPSWGLANTPASYYYLPDMDCYYDLRKAEFVYLNNGSWARNKQLPSRYKGYNLNNTRKIAINENAPYSHHNDFKNKYGRFDNGSRRDIGKNDNRYNNNRKDWGDRNDRNDRDDRNNNGRNNNSRRG